MGAQHNREASSVQLSYAHGYRRTTSGIRFRTMMSYNDGCSCQRIPYFSANGLFLSGYPIGSPTEDNARGLRINAPRTAGLM